MTRSIALLTRGPNGAVALSKKQFSLLRGRCFPVLCAKKSICPSFPLQPIFYGTTLIRSRDVVCVRVCVLSLGNFLSHVCSCFFFFFPNQHPGPLLACCFIKRAKTEGSRGIRPLSPNPMQNKPQSRRTHCKPGLAQQRKWTRPTCSSA